MTCGWIGLLEMEGCIFGRRALIGAGSRHYPTGPLTNLSLDAQMDPARPGDQLRLAGFLSRGRAAPFVFAGAFAALPRQSDSRS